MTKKAYLYNRVSKKVQATEGKGLKRQRLLAEEFLKQHPEYEISDIYEDAGRSAYYAKNLHKEAGLGGFIMAAEKGDIEPDSLLVIESVDRISRMGIKEGNAVLNRIFDCKINIGVVKYNTIYRWDNDNDLGNAIQIVSGLYLGKLESEQKSHRVKRTFDLKLEMARKGQVKFRPQVHPSWLTFNELENDYIEIPSKSEIVQTIFKLRLEQKLGIRRIIHYLNENEISPISDRISWTYTSINNLLKNTAVIGEYQPTERIVVNGKRTSVPKGEPIYNYYPPIITSEQFYAVQNSFTRRASHKKLQGRKSGYKNLFRHLTKCFICGSPMTFKQNYLACQQPSMQCSNSYVRYKDAEKTLNSLFSSTELIKPLQNRPTVENSESELLKHELQTLIDAQHNLEMSLEQINNEKVMTRIIQRIEEFESRKKDISNQLATLDENKATDLTALQITATFDLSNETERERYNALLLTHIDYIKFWGDYIIVKPRGRDYVLIDHVYFRSVFTSRPIQDTPSDYEVEILNDWCIHQGLSEEEITEELQEQIRLCDLSYFLKKLKSDEGIHRARYIYQRKIEEDLSRKQTTRILTREGVSITDEEHRRIRKELGISYPEDDV